MQNFYDFLKLKILRCVDYFKVIKSKRATYLKFRVPVENHASNMGYWFQVSSTLRFNIFKKKYTAFAFRAL